MNTHLPSDKSQMPHHNQYPTLMEKNNQYRTPHDILIYVTIICMKDVTSISKIGKINKWIKTHECVKQN
jgi:hypothetical protein